MTKFSSRFAASTVSIFASAWMALPAFAQEAEPVAPQAANQGIGDIIVTAQKRAQSVNDVGLSITTASGEQLRSEEHTSELQSLMRISYAVFCLKKKKSKQAH